ncbi:unnamed protein product [Cylindrotheca closterium]|uniref:Alpha/beta hydrolase fold-5 domain-containing protein n=1 Tax=Cylindrotheca closterium TaxID=2856 RepID=A0AAD2G7E1_9STRA|nr:unnamed protein product [Cylindrotheca closterium]
MSKIKQMLSFDSEEWDYKELTSLLEDLDLFEEPSLRFSQALLASSDLLAFLLKRGGCNPTKIAISCLLLSQVSNLVLPDCAWLRYTWFALIILSTLFLSMTVLFMAHIFVSKRQPAFKSAHNELWDRIQDGRALRNEGYDVFLPLVATSTTTTSNFVDQDEKEEKEPEIEVETNTSSSKHGIILFPGALINHTAYASLAAKLSDHGILVVIMSYGASRLTMDVAECQQRAQLAISEVTYELKALGLDDLAVKEWVLAGHSLGGTLALNAAAQMDNIEKVILFGVGRDAMGVPSSFASSDKQVLVINGSNDPFVTDCTDAQKTDFRDCLPPTAAGSEKKTKTTKGRTTYVTVEGGNHAGFAHYGPQTYPKQDGERTLSIDEQQEAFVQKTLELLNLVNF